MQCAWSGLELKQMLSFSIEGEMGGKHWHTQCGTMEQLLGFSSPAASISNPCAAMIFNFFFSFLISMIV